MKVEEILGDYDQFFAQIIEDLQKLDVDVIGLLMSQLGYKRKSINEYESVCGALLPLSDSMVENVHNGRRLSSRRTGPVVCGPTAHG